MNENKFTPRAEESLRLAQEAAQDMGHDYVGCEHLLLGLLRDKNMLGDVQTIDLSDTASVVMRYLDRFDVTFRWDADFDYKLDYLLAVVERLEVNEKGTIDMTQEGKASFIPG